jgi:hypothetical protein
MNELVMDAFFTDLLRIGKAQPGKEMILYPLNGHTPYATAIFIAIA